MYFLNKIVASYNNIRYINYYINQLVMVSLILYYTTWYLGIGFVSAFLIDQVIRVTQSSDPYTAREIFAVILLWPINVTVFIVSFIISFFR